MKIVGFSGSPRKSGSTAYAVNKVLEGATSGGAETYLFSAYSLDINPCQGCLGCVKGGGCVLKDDMQSIYTALRNSDALVFGSPIYMGQMNAQSKAFLDRPFAFITPRFSPRFKEENAGKKLVLVWTQGNPDGEKFKAYLDYTKMMFGMLEFDVKDVVVVTDTRTKVANEQTDIDDKLFEIGVNLIGKSRFD